MSQPSRAPALALRADGPEQSGAVEEVPCADVGWENGWCLAFVPDGYLDASGNIATAEALGYFVALRLPFGNGWRTNVMYGNTTIDYDDDVLAAGLNDTGWSFHWNVIYNILPKLDVGAEIMYAERDLIGGESGDFTRFIFSAKYAF